MLSRCPAPSPAEAAESAAVGAGIQISTAIPVPAGKDKDDAGSEDDLRPREPFLKAVEPSTPSSEDAPAAMKCVFICVYNYKGGVGKTETAIQLAATLARMGSKTCLIDADGQCNSTAFFHPAIKWAKAPKGQQQLQGRLDEPPPLIPADPLPADVLYCDVDSFKPLTWLDGGESYNYNENNINGMLAPVFSERPRITDLKAPKLLSVDPEFYKNNLLLLPGSTELLNVRLTNQTAMFECRRFGVFRKMFKEIAKAYSTDDSPLEFIIVDLGPSVDNLNKALVMSSDYVLPPAKADYFSANSAYGLLYEVLPGFVDWRKRHCNKVEGLGPKLKPQLEEEGFYDFESESGKNWPKVLPFLVSMYSTDKKMKMDLDSSNYLYSIRDLAAECGESQDDDNFYPAIRAAVKAMIVCDGDGHAAVPFCRHLPTAPSVAHRAGVPFVHLGWEDKKVDFDKHRKENGAGSHASTGKNDCKIAKKRFEVLAEFVKEQRRICLQDRYGIQIQIPDDDDKDNDDDHLKASTSKKRKLPHSQASADSVQPTRVQPQRPTSMSASSSK
jgi:cellulose biosynthesis protein BcsQ